MIKVVNGWEAETIAILYDQKKLENIEGITQIMKNSLLYI